MEASVTVWTLVCDPFFRFTEFTLFHEVFSWKLRKIKGEIMFNRGSFNSPLMATHMRPVKYCSNSLKYANVIFFFIVMLFFLS